MDNQEARNARYASRKASKSVSEGIELIEETSSVIALEGTKAMTFTRTGLDTRTFAWRERNPYHGPEKIVSRTYTFNGRDAWDVTNEART